MKQIRQRLTYANVMSSIAVFMVLGGATAFAATKIGANEIKANSIKTGKIVKEAVTTSKVKNAAINTSKLANDSVTTEKLAADAVTGEKAKESTFGEVPKANTANTATTASNALALGGKPAADYSIRYFARVNGTAANPTLAAGSPGVTVNSNRPFTGAATVNFPVDMTNCAVVVTGVSGGAEIAARQSTTSDGSAVVIVTTTVADPTVNTNFSFNVIGVC